MKLVRQSPKRRLFVPEVIQTSNMDCGPAALTSLLTGFGLSVSYGRLREACQTDVDGTSIDTLETIAVECGLNAEQMMIPLDHLLLPEAMALPAIVVVRRPGGTTHFVVVWRCHGHLVQVMDPATGRRWLTKQNFLRDVHEHTLSVPEADWRHWAATEEFLEPLRRRWKQLRIDERETASLLATALADASWFALAALDAATRMLSTMVRGGGLRRGRQATQGLRTFFDRALTEGPGQTRIVPKSYWTVRPVAPEPGEEPCLRLCGVVTVCVRRWPTRSEVPDEGATPEGLEELACQSPMAPEGAPALAATLAAPSIKPARQLLQFLREEGLWTPSAFAIGSFMAAASVVIEALLWRGLVDISRDLVLVPQRLAALAALLIFLCALMLFDLVNTLSLARLGRHLEARLRMAFQAKIPRLGDRYFQSRPISDMAERLHSVHRLRLLPGLGGKVIHVAAEIVFTTAGLMWLDPSNAWLPVLAAICILSLPLTTHSAVSERDLRVRTHAGALSLFSLDSLLGLTAVQTHGAERAVQREFESLLTEWARAGFHLQRMLVGVGGVQGLLSFALVICLMSAYLAGEAEASGMLLLTYWALRLPVLGQELMRQVQQYPTQYNTMLRLLEPLGAPEELSTQGAEARQPMASITEAETSAPGVAIVLDQVSVRAGGHTILQDLSLNLAPGSHVAIVGASGAGKSSLVGLLLGWHRPSSGRITVDGEPIDSACLARLRQVTAWVDPAVQLWNRSLLDNLHYGSRHHAVQVQAQAIEQAEMRQILERLPDGLQTLLGEGGGLVSGGEGQRVRFGRALTRPGARLVILDEPFRGLDGERRRVLLERARQVWHGATLLCITHDVGSTQAFERVLVVDDGRIVEDDSPSNLAERPGGHYRALLQAEAAAHERLWASHIWRRLRLAEGRLQEAGSMAGRGD